MSTDLALRPPSDAPAPGTFTPEQIDLIKRQIAPGVSNDELSLFLEVCRSSGLNPFQRQIYAIVRQESYKDTRTGRWEKRPKMTIQTGIDGYRLIASRTRRHAGTSDPQFGPEDANGRPAWARVTVRRLIAAGHVADFAATARWSEYVQTDRDGKPSGLWAKMPHTMLGKCAEALALRKAFPAELSGVYTKEEMMQADGSISEVIEAVPLPPSEPLRRAGGDGAPDGGEIARQVYGGPEHNTASAAVPGIDEVTERRVVELGVLVYGDAWQGKASGLAQWVSKNEASALRDLTAEEGARLVAKLEKRLAEAAANDLGEDLDELAAEVLR